MEKPKLTYWDEPVSRGEECRLALHAAGVDFEDVRIKRAAWPALKPTTPYGTVPMFQVPGKPVIGQSTAILVYIGRTSDLHPKDDYEAARHESVLVYAEELRDKLGATLFISDDAEKKRAREAIAAGYIPEWAARIERQIATDGPFFAGTRLHVVDFRIHMIVRWLTGGKLDHVPTTVLDPFEKMLRVSRAVQDHPSTKSWYARG